MMDSTTGGMLFGGGFMWIFWILLIILVVVGFKSFSGGAESSSASMNDSAMNILKSRYAKGEIDEDEFKRRRKELEV